MTMAKNSKRQEMQSNNRVVISGYFESDFEYEYSFNEKKFFTNCIKVNQDTIKVVAEEKQIKTTSVKGMFSLITGELRSRNIKDEEGKSHIILYMYSKEEVKVLKNYHEKNNSNYIKAFGYICRKREWRVTKKGKKICDFMVAVHRGEYETSDYLPCITWGKNAIKMERQYEIGDPVIIQGRIQSRTYWKRSDTEVQRIVVNEVNVEKICHWE